MAIRKSTAYGIPTQLVGVGHPAREHHGVVVVGAHLLGDLVHRETAGPVQVMHGLGHPRLRGDQFGSSPGIHHSPPGLGQFHLFDTLIGHQKGHSYVVQFIAHAIISSLCPYPRGWLRNTGRFGYPHVGKGYNVA